MKRRTSGGISSRVREHEGGRMGGDDGSEGERRGGAEASLNRRLRFAVQLLAQ